MTRKVGKGNKVAEVIDKHHLNCASIQVNSALVSICEIKFVARIRFMLSDTDQ